ncbi:MAG: serine hydrolase domain-containing protein [Gaiellales bacterium]
MDRPTLDNWMRPPHPFWSFRHVRELIPTARIRHGHHPRTLPFEPAGNLLELRFESTAGERVLGEFLQNTQSDALIAVKDGRVVLEWMAAGIRDDEPHLMFSVTKSITALLCGALVGAGRIDTDAPVVRYVPEVADSGFGDATVRHLLDMEAAYAFVEDYSPGPDIVLYRNSAGWYPAPPDHMGLHGFLASREKEGEHGQRFRYMSPTTDMLGWVCEAASGLPYAVAVSQYLWVPMGAEADGDITLDRFGTPRAAGGLSATPRDLARVGMIVAEGGAGIVPEDFVDDLTTGGDPEHWAIGDYADWLPGGCYRSCWYQPRVDPDCVMAVGIHGQMIYVDRPRNIVVVKQSSWDVPDDNDRHSDNEYACRAIARALTAGEPDALLAG